jgi:hypothetical protein
MADEYDEERLLIVGILAFAALAAGGFFLGGPTLLIGVLISAGVIAALWRGAIEMSLPFALSVAAVAGAAAWALPSSLIAPLGDLAGSFGLPQTEILGDVSAGLVAVLAGVMMLAVIVGQNVRDYKTTRAERLAENTRDDLSDILSTYVTVGRVVAGLGLVLLGSVFAETGNLLVEFGDLVSEAPLVAAQGATAVLGFLGLGGELPVIGSIPGVGTMSATTFAVIAIVLLGAGWYIREEVA